jgi:hypothetical protein
VIIYSLKTKVDIKIAVPQLAVELENLIVKTVIVIDNRFPFNQIVKTLKDSPIEARVRIKQSYKLIIKSCQAVGQ